MATIYGVEVADIITASPDKTDSAKSKRRTTVSIHSKAVYIQTSRRVFIEKQHDKSYG